MPRPARPWFRIWSELLESRKAQSLGRERPELFVHWINLMCLANVSTPRGSIPAVQDVAFALRLDEQAANKVLTELRQKRFIDSAGRRLVMHDWEDWQKESDARNTSGRSAADAAHNGGGIAAESPHRGRGRGSEEDQEEETEVEGGEIAPAPLPEALMGAYVQKLGELTPRDARSLARYAGDLPHAWIEAAIDETASTAEEPGFPYLTRILARCKRTNKPPSTLAKAARRRTEAPSANAFKRRFEEAQKGNHAQA